MKVSYSGVSFSKNVEESFNLWIIPFSETRTSINIDELESIIRQLLEKPYFPSQDITNDYILQNKNFLNIKDKYLLINYITNYTHFAQSYVNLYNIQPNDFRAMLNDIKINNQIPEQFISFIQSYYSEFHNIHQLISKNEFNKIEHRIKNLPEDEQIILYARLYLNGYEKYKKYYEYTEKYQITDEMLLYDKISYHFKQNNYSKVALYINQLPPTLVNGTLWWNNSQKIIIALVKENYIENAYTLLSKIHLNMTHKHNIRKEIFSGAIATLLHKPTHAYEHFYNAYEKSQTLEEKTQGSYFVAQSYLKTGNHNAYKYWLTLTSEHPTLFYGAMAINELYNKNTQFILGDSSYKNKSWESLAQQRYKLHRKHYDKFIKTNILHNHKSYKDLPKETQELLQIAQELNNKGYHKYAKEFIIHAIKLIQDTSLIKPLLENICQSYNKYTCTDAKRTAENIGYFEIERFKTIKSKEIHKNIEDAHLPLLFSIIKKESNFNIVISSHVGATGMMQIMPNTAKFICSRHKIDYNHQKLRTNPSYNIMLGTIYLNELLERYNGSYIRALAAYNAGYGNLKKWEDIYLEAKNNQDMIMMIELIPYQETRDYVRKILQWEGIYGYILNQNAYFE